MRTPVALSALVLAFLAIPVASSAATPCWESVITDWSHDQQVNGRYSTACIRQAMQNAPTDLKIYSTLEDDLQAVLQKRSARRLSGVHPAAASIAAPGGSSVSPLVIVLGGLGGLVAISAVLASVRRRRALR